MSFTGYDIEDASILNKASLDRGFGRMVYMRRHQVSLKKYQNGAEDQIMTPPTMPPPTDRKANMFKKYRALDKDGFAHVGSELHDGDIFINKYNPDPSSFPNGSDILD
jgi:DNA-directed RNA polymerase III subunit RPC2